jgi:hypothetical protein
MKMQSGKLFLLCGVGLCLAQLGFSQEIPKVEIFGGVSYLRFNGSSATATGFAHQLGSTTYIQTPSSSANLLGWNSNVTENLNSWFAGEFNVSGAYGSPTANFLSPTSPSLNLSQHVPVLTGIHTFTYGPRFSYRRNHTVVFAHILVGGAHFNGSIQQPAAFTANGGLGTLASDSSFSATAFAVEPGAGVQLSLNSRVSIRPVQVDYLMTRFYQRRQDSLRFSAGVVFNLGTK